MKKFINILIYFTVFFIFSISSNAQNNALVFDKTLDDFSYAISMTSDPKGFIYVLDNESCEIVKLTSGLAEVKRSGKKGWDNGEFYSPSNIDCSTGLSLYVADKKNGRIQNFDLNLGFTSSIITDMESLDPKYRCRFPVASIVLNTKDLYVVDEDNPKVVVFESSVNPVSYFASYQSGSDALVMPSKIAKDSRNILYILDKQKNAILKYDNFGSYISSITTDSIKAMTIMKNILYIISGDYLLYYNVDGNAYTNKIYLPGTVNRNEITDILVSNTNELYVLEKTKISSFIIK